MSNIVEFNASSAPSFVKRGELSAVARALVGGGGGSGGGKRISIRGGVFRLVSEGKEVAAIEDRHLDVVVVNAAPKVSRTFYMKKYDGDTPSAPDCWSADGEKPNATSANAQAESCATCPQNIAGSGDGNSRACRYSQRLAVVLANNIDGDVMQLSLPAQSIFGKEEGDNRPLQAYARYMAAQGAGADMVVTRLKFDTKAAVPKLFFKAMRWLTDEEYATSQEKGASKEAVNAVTMTVAQTDKVPPAPVAGTAPKAKKAAKPVAPVEDEDTAEPAVRKEAAGAAVPKREANLANIVDAWDETDD